MAPMTMVVIRFLMTQVVAYTLVQTVIFQLTDSPGRNRAANYRYSGRCPTKCPNGRSFTRILLHECKRRRLTICLTNIFPRSQSLMSLSRFGGQEGGEAGEDRSFPEEECPANSARIRTTPVTCASKQHLHSFSRVMLKILSARVRWSTPGHQIRSPQFAISIHVDLQTVGTDVSSDFALL